VIERYLCTKSALQSALTLALECGSPSVERHNMRKFRKRDRGENRWRGSEIADNRMQLENMQQTWNES